MISLALKAESLPNPFAPRYRFSLWFIYLYGVYKDILVDVKLSLPGIMKYSTLMLGVWSFSLHNRQSFFSLLLNQICNAGQAINHRNYRPPFLFFSAFRTTNSSFSFHKIGQRESSWPARQNVQKGQLVSYESFHK